jgi:hypothetical protein
MSAREADQAAVLARVVAGTLRLGEGAELLRLSYRHAKRLLARYRQGGVRGRLRPSGRRRGRTIGSRTAHCLSVRSVPKVRRSWAYRTARH